jgi:uridine phosphorylase
VKCRADRGDGGGVASLIAPTDKMTGMTESFPILEFDPDRSALIAPSRSTIPPPVPTRAVVCFFREVIEAERAAGRAVSLGHFLSEQGEHHLFRLSRDGVDVAVFHPSVGAPLAVGLLEEAIAVGCRTFVVCGGAGALVPDLTLGHVIVPTSAVRDEGTSYHYAPPSREIQADPALVAAALALLKERGIPHVAGKTWTTDAFFRETPGKIRQRRDEGCITVEMEASAFMAAAQFRGVDLVQYLYAGDDVSGEAWDHRHWTTSSARQDLFDLSVDLAIRL